MLKIDSVEVLKNIHHKESPLLKIPHLDLSTVLIHQNSHNYPLIHEVLSVESDNYFTIHQILALTYFYKQTCKTKKKTIG